MQFRLPPDIGPMLLLLLMMMLMMMVMVSADGRTETSNCGVATGSGWVGKSTDPRIRMAWMRPDLRPHLHRVATVLAADNP